MNIVEKLSAEYGGRVEVPPADPKRVWLRFSCPFCGGERAAVSHQLGWFICYHCKREITAREYQSSELAVNRFARQIARAVKRVKYAYGRWVEDDALETAARWLVFNYDTGREKTNDGGMLADWEGDFDGEPWRVDGKVQSALDRDLMNYAESEKRWKEKTHASGDMLGEAGEDATVTTSKKGTRATMKIRRRNRAFYRSAPPKDTDLSGRPLNLGKLQRCESMRNGVGPIPGHCKWCNRAIADEIVDPYDRKYHKGKLDLADIADLADVAKEVPEMGTEDRPAGTKAKLATIQRDAKAATQADMSLAS